MPCEVTRRQQAVRATPPTGRYAGRKRHIGVDTLGLLLRSAEPAREPEGLAIYRTAAGEARLFIGFATGVEGDRRSSIFYKNALV